MTATPHDDVLLWTSRALDGELPERERILLEDHLAGCPACAQVAADWRGVQRAIARDALSRSPIGLADRIMARVTRESGEVPAMRSEPAGLGVVPLIRRLRVSVALAAGLLAVAAGLWLATAPTQAMAGSERGIASSDPALARVLDRWQQGRRAPPSFFELILTPPARR